jgi:hypothetical protein
MQHKVTAHDARRKTQDSCEDDLNKVSRYVEHVHSLVAF